MKRRGVVAIGTVALAAAAAQGVQVSTTGRWVIGPVGSSAPVALNTAGSTSFNAGTGSNSVAGQGRYSAFRFGDQVCLELTLTQFTWAVNSTGAQTLTVTMSQDFNLGTLTVVGTGLASHQVNGTFTAGNSGQVFQMTANTSHEGTALPVLSVNPAGFGTATAGTFLINRSTPSVNVTVSGSIYTITSTYVFNINAGSSSMSVNLPDSAVTSVCMTVSDVPILSCDSIDFNNDGSIFDPIDIDAFLSRYGEGPCIPANFNCNDIDFNNDQSLFDPCDIDSFLTKFSEGPCTLCGQ